MNKIFTGLCAALLLSFTLLTPLGETSNTLSHTGNMGISTLGFYRAIEGQ